MRKRVGKLAALALFGFGCAVVGGRIENGSEPPTSVPHTSAPKVIVEKKTVEVPKLPESCKRAFDMAVSVRGAAEDYDTTTGKQIDIMDDAVKAIFEKDYKALNILITRQRAVRDATVPASDTLHRELAKFDTILGQCDAELGG